MKLFVFAVRDLAINAYDRPFFVSHLGMAERGFSDAINDPSSNLYKHPEDYELYQLGTFDDGAGVFEVGIPTQVCTGKSVVKAGSRDVSSVQTDAFPVGPARGDPGQLRARV